MIWFKFYSAWGDGIQELTDEEAGRLIKAVCKFAEDGKVEQPAGVERILFAMVVKQMKQDAEHAEKVSSVRAEARRGKGQMKSNDSVENQMLSNDINSYQLITNDNNENQMLSNDAIKNKELRTNNSEQRIKNQEQESRVNARDKKPIKHKRGQFQHVLLTDEEYGKLVDQFPEDFRMRIQNLDNYLENNRKKHYDNHYLTILNWARKDATQQSSTIQTVNKSFADIAKELETAEGPTWDIDL